MERKESIQWDRSEEKMPSFWQFLLESLPPASREKLLENVVSTTIPR